MKLQKHVPHLILLESVNKGHVDTFNDESYTSRKRLISDAPKTTFCGTPGKVRQRNLWRTGGGAPKNLF
jgi:hypothetical protein